MARTVPSSRLPPGCCNAHQCRHGARRRHGSFVLPPSSEASASPSSCWWPPAGAAAAGILPDLLISLASYSSCRCWSQTPSVVHAPPCSRSSHAAPNCKPRPLRHKRRGYSG